MRIFLIFLLFACLALALAQNNEDEGGERRPGRGGGRGNGRLGGGRFGRRPGRERGDDDDEEEEDDDEEDDEEDGEEEPEMTEEEFEEKFNVPVRDPAERRRRARELRRAQRAIRRQNRRNRRGESSFTETLYSDSNLPFEERAKLKCGAIDEGDDGEVTAADRFNPIGDAYFNSLNRNNLPVRYNAVDDGLITKVKGQQSCGSCVAFATAAVVETCLIKEGTANVNVDLSEQELLDCAYNGHSANGCSGAVNSAYLDFLANGAGNGRLPSEANYAYKNVRGSCRNVGNVNGGARVTNMYESREITNNDLVKAAIREHGSVISSLWASSNFMNYRSGVFDERCTSTRTNHAIQLIGWDRDSQGEYWIGKNSWDTWWGEAGYFRIRFNSCLIGTNMVVAKCTRNNQTPDPAPTLPQCDVTGWLQGLPGGTFSGRVGSTEIYCEGNMCTPNPVPTNGDACTPLCGRSTCRRS